MMCKPSACGQVDRTVAYLASASERWRHWKAIGVVAYTQRVAFAAMPLGKILSQDHADDLSGESKTRRLDIKLDFQNKTININSFDFLEILMEDGEGAERRERKICSVVDEKEKEKTRKSRVKREKSPG